MWSADCICCSPDTVQQASARCVLAGTPSRTCNIVYVQCRCCGSKVCSFCVCGLKECVATCKKKIPEHDPSIAALESMALALKSNDCPKVDFGIAAHLVILSHLLPRVQLLLHGDPPRSPFLTRLILSSHWLAMNQPTKNAVAILTTTKISTAGLQISSLYTSEVRIHLRQWNQATLRPYLDVSTNVDASPGGGNTSGTTFKELLLFQRLVYCWRQMQQTIIWAATTWLWQNLAWTPPKQ